MEESIIIIMFKYKNYKAKRNRNTNKSYNKSNSKSNKTFNISHIYYCLLFHYFYHSSFEIDIQIHFL